MNRDNAGERQEFSAGGIVVRKGQVLLVKVETLMGDKVWTFPKGHLENGEDAPSGAVREVEEETGWRCRIVKPLPLVRYEFTREKRLIRKKVQWYLMEPGLKIGKPDAAEIHKCEWMTFEKAEEKLSYPSDHKLLATVRELALTSPGTGEDGRRPGEGNL